MGKNLGTFIISLDTELAWGSFDKGLTDVQRIYFSNTRPCIIRLLELLDKYNISATFALVGHLMLNECHAENGVKHGELIRPNFKWYKKDWFTEDPATSIDRDPIWYGKDILEQIRGRITKHEIASHSFSHIIFGDSGCSKDCAETDIAACVKTASENGIKLTSFVFPRNSEGHKDILKKYGFTAYRGDGNEWYKKINNHILRKLCHYCDNLFSLSPLTSTPFKDDENLYNCIGNMLYLSRAGMRKYISVKSRVRKAIKGIDRAIQTGEVFHLWFHPFNLASDPDGLIDGLDEIFAYVNKNVEAGNLESLTIKQACEKYESNKLGE